MKDEGFDSAFKSSCAVRSISVACPMVREVHHNGSSIKEARDTAIREVLDIAEWERADMVHAVAQFHTILPDGTVSYSIQFSLGHTTD